MSIRRRAYVGVGSNVARAPSLACGLRSLGQQFGVLELSTVYESAPVDGVGEAYWNLVVAFDTALNYSQLRAQLKTIEDLCGRTRGADVDGAVVLDLDVLLLRAPPPDGDQFDLPLAALERASYVLAPLAELLPEWRHPACDVTLAQLWRAAAPGALHLQVVAPNELPPLAQPLRDDPVACP